MKRSLRLAFATVAATVLLAAADNTLGTWKMNLAKSSNPLYGTAAITKLTVVREAAEGGAKVSATGDLSDGSKIDVTYTVKYNGQEFPVTGAAWDTSSIRQVDTNTLTEERTKKGGAYHVTLRHMVSNGGKILTTTSKGTGPDGKPFTSTTVFDRQ